MMRLIHIGNLHCLAHIKSSGIRRFLPHNQSEQSGLSGSVRPDYSNYAIGRQSEIQVLEQLLLAKRLAQSGRLYHLLSETRTVGNKDFQTLLSLFLVLIEQPVIRVEARLTFA